MIAGLYKPFEHWSKSGTVWIYSDPHFQDEDTKFFDEGRPTDEELVAKINAKVGKYDTLIILGDIGDVNYVKRLRGYKVLICGNHDIGPSKYLRCKTDIEDNHLFDEVYSGPLIISEKLILSHEPIDLPYMFNIHGHVHNKSYKGDKNHLNCVAEVINYTPISLNKLCKDGVAKDVQSIHRMTIDYATKHSLKTR